MYDGYKQWPGWSLFKFAHFVKIWHIEKLQSADQPLFVTFMFRHSNFSATNQNRLFCWCQEDDVIRNYPIHCMNHKKNKYSIIKRLKFWLRNEKVAHKHTHTHTNEKKMEILIWIQSQHLTNVKFIYVHPIFKEH